MAELEGAPGMDNGTVLIRESIGVRAIDLVF